jgi:hypothetical protein
MLLSNPPTSRNNQVSVTYLDLDAILVVADSWHGHAA